MARTTKPGIQRAWGLVRKAFQESPGCYRTHKQLHPPLKAGFEPKLEPETKFPSRKREECGRGGQVKRVGCEYVTHLPAYAGKRGQRPFLGSSSPNPVSRAGATGWRAQSLNYLSRTPRTLLRESRSYCLAEPWLFLPGDSKSA